ncbi:MAG: Gldg family protein, partial [Thermodesulfobacteriota bacterium]|nr:Gldg family protein [Thermodesulfobacteriota bacterium]
LHRRTDCTAYRCPSHRAGGISRRFRISHIKEQLETEYYDIEDLLLMGKNEVPEDSSLLVISGPEKDPFPFEFDSIKKYLEKGGRVLFMLDPYVAPAFSSFLKQYNVILEDDIIIDKENKLFGYEERTPIISDFTTHEITRAFAGAGVTFVFSLARSVGTKESGEEEGKNIETELEEFLKTSKDSWKELDKKSVESSKITFDPDKDTKGPITVGVAGKLTINTKDTKDKKGIKKEGRFVVYGDSDFANNFYWEILGNRDLFLNTISWLTEEGILISIREKKQSAMPKLSPFFLSDLQGRIILFVTVIFMPVLFLIIGIFIYIQRKFYS